MTDVKGDKHHSHSSQPDPDGCRQRRVASFLRQEFARVGSPKEHTAENNRQHWARDVEAADHIERPRTCESCEDQLFFRSAFSNGRRRHSKINPIRYKMVAAPAPMMARAGMGEEGFAGSVGSSIV